MAASTTTTASTRAKVHKQKKQEAFSPSQLFRVLWKGAAVEEEMSAEERAIIDGAFARAAELSDDTTFRAGVYADWKVLLHEIRALRIRLRPIGPKKIHFP